MRHRSTRGGTRADPRRRRHRGAGAAAGRAQSRLTLGVAIVSASGIDVVVEIEHVLKAARALPCVSAVGTWPEKASANRRRYSGMELSLPQRRQPPHPRSRSVRGPSATFAGVVGLSGGAPAERGRSASIPWVPTSIVRERSRAPGPRGPGQGPRSRPSAKKRDSQKDGTPRDPGDLARDARIPGKRQLA